MPLRPSKVDVRVRHFAGDGNNLAEDGFECWEGMADDFADLLEGDTDFVVIVKADGTSMYYKRDQIVSISVSPQ